MDAPHAFRDNYGAPGAGAAPAPAPFPPCRADSVRALAGTPGPTASQRPLVALYLYLDDAGATTPPHPSVKTSAPERYLECAVTQAASLRLQGAPCEIALVTNAQPARGARGRAGRLWGALRDLGVELLEGSAPPGDSLAPARERLLRRAIDDATAGQASTRRVWLPNLDSVWADPSRALAAELGDGQLGCLQIDYPADWRIGGDETVGASRTDIARTVARLGDAAPIPAWVGGDLLTGRTAALLAAAAEYDELDARLRAEGHIAGNEQLLTLLSALGRIRFRDLGKLAGRVQTGARHRAASGAGAAQLAIWHLPAEKGLSLRRAARTVARGGSSRLVADLGAPPRAARRFNVGRARRARQLRDDAWVGGKRLAEALGRG